MRNGEGNEEEERVWAYEAGREEGKNMMMDGMVEMTEVSWEKSSREILYIQSGKDEMQG